MITLFILFLVFKLLITFYEQTDIGIIVGERTIGDQNVVFVSKVLPDSSALSYGIVEGSVLLNINGEPCTTKETATEALKKLPRPIKIQFQLDLESFFAAVSASSQSKVEHG